jgi:hypothetical protein
LYVFGKLASVGVEYIAMECEVVEKRDGQIDGRGSSGGSRDVGLSCAVAAAVVAAMVVAAGDGGARRRLYRGRRWRVERALVVVAVFRIALRRAREYALSVRRLVSVLARAVGVWRVAALAAKVMVRLALEASRAVCWCNFLAAASVFALARAVMARWRRWRRRAVADVSVVVEAARWGVLARVPC